LVAVAQLAERRDVAPEVAGSSPVGHPLAPGEPCVPAVPRAVRWYAGASSSTAEQRTLNPQVPGSNPGGRTSWPEPRVAVQAYESLVVSYPEAVHARAIWERVPQSICDRLARGERVANSPVTLHLALPDWSPCDDGHQGDLQAANYGSDRGRTSSLCRPSEL
jgi:hypothetical protein